MTIFRGASADAAVDFDAYVAARSMALRRLAVLLTGDEGHADDAVQTALLAAWRRWDRISRLDHVDAYLRVVLLNAVRNQRRGLGRRREVLGVVGADQPVRDATDAVVERDPLWQALRRLPERQRAVVVLRFYEDLSEAQTAAALGCHVGTVKRYTARALETLRRDARLAPAAPTEVRR